MWDSEPVLVNGNGTPYLAIFDGQGNPIYDDLNNIPIGMETESFSYKYTEGKGDSGKFTIVTNYVGIVDHPSLQFKMPLWLQWGWIFSDGSFKPGPPRLVNVKSHEIQFTPQGTRFTIHFADASLFLSAAPANYAKEASDWLSSVKYLAKGLPPGLGIYVDHVTTRTGLKPVALQINPNCDGEENQRNR